MKRSAADQYAGVVFLCQCHQLTDNLLELWESQEEEEKEQDLQDNMHRRGTQDVLE